MASFAALVSTFGGVLYMHSYKLGGWTLTFGVIYLAVVAGLFGGGMWFVKLFMRERIRRGFK